ncbi:MAG: 3-phosphoshikimate 1-carboxyvinyltransferase [Candidatus Zixiibacteriota bacterium]
MPRKIHPTKKYGGTISVPGDKSIGHRAALLSILSKGDIKIINFPRNADCLRSLEAARAFGVRVSEQDGIMRLSPPETLTIAPDTLIECGNSATTARLLFGIIAGSNLTVTLSGDDSLSRRPMARVIEPLSAMGAEVFSKENKLPVKISGKKLLPFDYELPIPSAQVKSAVLLAGLASSCSVNVREKTITRDHTEIMLEQLGEGVEVREIKPVMVQDPVDPRKKKMHMPESFKKEIRITSQTRVNGGTVDIPGDFSTAAFFMAGAAVSKKTITIENVGLNPTRTGFLDYLRAAGCKVEITEKRTVSGELRGSVTVTGGELKARKIAGDSVVELIDEIPALSVVAAFADGTTVIRDAGELRAKESDRLEAITENLKLMGVKCGVLEDGLAIEGRRELTAADFKSFGDHRIAMAFSVASLFLIGPSSIDNPDIVEISCPGFYSLLDKVTA